MVIKPFTHLARQSFGKTFTHGYAQSVVAATQSSYASSATPFPHFGHQHRHARPQTSQPQAYFQHSTTSSTFTGKAGSNLSDGLHTEDCGLHAYFEAWQRRQQQHGAEDKEWKQFQFARRIEWKHPSGTAGGPEQGLPHDDAPGKLRPSNGLDRSYSTSAIDGLKKDDEVGKTTTVASIDTIIAQGTSYSKKVLDMQIDSQSNLLESSEKISPTFSSLQLPQSQEILHNQLVSPQGSISPFGLDSNLINSKALTISNGEEHAAFLDHIAKLHADGEYVQIPTVFEAMLAQGIYPTAQAYNALLEAAVVLTPKHHQIVSRALDVYSDMLRRKIIPDTAFYARLIDLLSYRAIECYQSRLRLNKKLLRCSDVHNKSQHLLPSDGTEHAISTEDDALFIAFEMFKAAIMHDGCSLPKETYAVLVIACAQHNLIDEMIQVYAHMERQKIRPKTDIFPPMIEAFARNHHLSDAVECYAQYRKLATADFYSTSDFEDVEVYSALVKAFTICGEGEGADRFIAKIVKSYSDPPKNQEERVADALDTIILEGIIEGRVYSKDYSIALHLARVQDLTPAARTKALARISAAAADHDHIDVALEAWNHADLGSNGTDAALAILAFYVRSGETEKASRHWNAVRSSTKLDQFHVPVILYYVFSLIRDGQLAQAALEAREGFRCMRNSVKSTQHANELREQIGEAIGYIATLMTAHSVELSRNASLELLWTMVENRNVMSTSAEQMLAHFSPVDVNSLGEENILLVLRVEAGLLGSGDVITNTAHCARFHHLLDLCMENQMTLDESSIGLVRRAIDRLSDKYPQERSIWQRYQSMFDSSASSSHISRAAPALLSKVKRPAKDAYDPYAAKIDYRGSSNIIEELETRHHTNSLNEALIKLKNIRRSGKIPRYLAYAKLISAAGREGRLDLTYDLICIARTDLPLQAAIPTVRHGWTLILDAMIGACLNAGQRGLAEQYHDELLNFGAAPSANTFGLYITSLSETAKIFDEATEAVLIFNRAKAEGVTPSSFLYNALIGKLGKARRIDDCLRFFKEMTVAGLHPTSVTYGTIVNALCRVSDERLAEQFFEEMEAMPDYKARPAPYNSFMQFTLNTKRDSKKVLAYYERMLSKNIRPTMHTYKLLIDTYATLEPINFSAAEGVLDTIRSSGQHPEAIHFASLIHAKGCVLHDMEGARRIFEQALICGEIRLQACLYQALFECMVANHCVAQTEPILEHMSARGIEMTPYIANTLIHGWATEKMVRRSKAIYDSVSMSKREPSTYEAMTRAFLTIEDHENAMATVQEMLSRGYPSAVSNKILELVSHRLAPADSFACMRTGS